MLTYNLDKDLLDIQRKFLHSKKQYAGIVSSRSTGKTFILSWMIVLSLMKGERSIIFSQTYSSLKQNLMAEVLNRFRFLQSQYPEIADELVPQYNKADMTIEFNGGRAFGYSYENYENTRGQTDVSLLILDEVAMAPADLLDIVGPCLRGQEIKPRIRFCTTPRIGSIWNRRFKEHMSLGDWDIFTGSYKDNYKLSAESVALIESSVSDPIMRKQELEGEIMETSIENCILADVTLPEKSSGRDSNYVMGIDCARFGVDSTVILVRDSYQVVEILPLYKADTNRINAEAEKLIQKYKPRAIFIDGTGGWGSGIEDYLKLSYKVISVNFGGKAKDEYNLNARADLYTNLIKAIDNGFYISDNTIKDELFATSYVITNAGKKAIVPKEQIKEIIGHSPDTTDALALTFYDENVIDKSRERQLIDIMFR